MTNREAVNEVTSDLQRVRRKIYSHTDMLYKKLKQNKAEFFYEVFDYTSPNKNTWFYSVRFTSKKNIKKGKCFISVACWYVSNMGFRVCVPSLNGRTPFMILSGHLFDRYKERTGCEIENRLDLIKHYFEYNNAANFRMVDESLKLNDVDTEKGKCDMYRNNEKGIELGYIDHEFNAIIMNTFVSNNMLGHKQTEIKEKMDKVEMRKLMPSSADGFLDGNRRSDKDMINYYRAVKKLESVGIMSIDDIDKMDDYDESMDKLEYLIGIVGEKRAKEMYEAMKQIKNRQN